MNKSKNAVTFFVIGTILALILSIAVSYETKYFLSGESEFRKIWLAN